ncbi:hypothetical protein ERJ75_000602600 [Trypanosoma vivax]|nr:hypothetical protein ERJ75_000602600 [Trypanosoma vivax]
MLPNTRRGNAWTEKDERTLAAKNATSKGADEEKLNALSRNLLGARRGKHVAKTCQEGGSADWRPARRSDDTCTQRSVVFVGIAKEEEIKGDTTRERHGRLKGRVWKARRIKAVRAPCMEGRKTVIAKRVARPAEKQIEGDETLPTKRENGQSGAQTKTESESPPPSASTHFGIMPGSATISFSHADMQWQRDEKIDRRGSERNGTARKQAHEAVGVATDAVNSLSDQRLRTDHETRHLETGEAEPRREAAQPEAKTQSARRELEVKGRRDVLCDMQTGRRTLQGGARREGRAKADR